ncbi:restriction endonuclease subunit S [Gammaproteobacteria bacterium]|nr:restriction endonuclease subunit S [Gammaproteobacteria bacterium]
MSSVSVLKDTEYEWIGSIPSHWELLKIKYVFWDRKENNNPIKTDNLISLTIDKGVIPHSEKTGGGNKPKEDLSKYKLVYPGDIVLNSMNVIAGAVGISKYFGLVSPVYYMLIPRNVDHSNEYFHHLFRTETFQKSLYGLGNGILIKESEETGKLNTIRMRIPMDKLGNQFIPVPPPEEQKLISRYLDKKTEQIDSLIEKIQKKIELLKEQRTSLINQCVTKGLDPNVEMKDSGVEWIGEIPSHWEITKLKYNGKVIIGLSFDKEDVVDPDTGTLVLRSSNVQGGKVVFDDNLWVKTVVPEKLHTKIGDILICTRNGSRNLIGKNCLLGDESLGMTWGVFMTVFRSNVPNFFHWILNSQVFKSQSGLYLTSTINQLTVSTLENLTFPFIEDPVEQKSIIDFLDETTSQIDQSIGNENRRITLLKEYRQSLISSVVTGKVRVTEDMI